MLEFGNRLIASNHLLDRPSAPGSPGLFTGRFISSDVRFRVGFWPIISEAHPEIGMALVAILSTLLERWPSIVVYRILARVQGEPNAYEWTIDKSQFGVDDWSIDSLDENVAVWGILSQDESGYVLSLQVENDLFTDNAETFSNTWSGTDLSSLIALLPQVSQAIASYLGAGIPSSFIPNYQISSKKDETLPLLLKSYFQWELSLFLFIWGKPWNNSQILHDYRRLLEYGSVVDSQLASWMISNAIARIATIFGAALDKTIWQELTAKTNDPVTVQPLYQHILALTFLRLGDRVKAYDLLELIVEDNPFLAEASLLLSELYWQENEPGAALNILQQSIESGEVRLDVLLRYAEMLLALDTSNVTLSVGARRKTVSGRVYNEKFAFIDPDHVRENQVINEAIETYKVALDMVPSNGEILLNLFTHLVDIRSEEAASYFSRLVAADLDGGLVRIAVESFYSISDLSPYIEILADAIVKSGGRADLRLSLARCYLMDERPDLAKLELIAVRQLAPISYRNETERLLLAVEDAEFETYLSEIADGLDTGKQLTVQDIDYLESVIERAPFFADAYILLAKGYQSWAETSDALEVLLDGQKVMPNEPNIAALLASVLWQSGESHMAFNCLNNALRENPRHVPLLALTGRFLFEDGQRDEAKNFLALAESLDPRNQVLMQVRVFIANALQS